MFGAVVHLLGPVPYEVPEVPPRAPTGTPVDGTQVLPWGNHIVPSVLRPSDKHIYLSIYIVMHIHISIYIHMYILVICDMVYII